MPFKSLAQEHWAHTAEGKKALGGPQAVAEWDTASKGMKLPYHAADAKHHAALKHDPIVIAQALRMHVRPL